MAYWLMKSEPGNWSWDDQVKDGVAEWDGVRNYQAANNMKAMKIGDKAFFYHSVKEKLVVGIVEVVKLYYPDPTDASGRFGMVDVKALRPFAKPVSLAEIKSEPSLENLALKIADLSPLPDNLYLISDGLPTQGTRAPRGNTVSGRQRMSFFRDAIGRIPPNIPINVILLPMEGDPLAAAAYWDLSQISGGAFLAPSDDWP